MTTELKHTRGFLSLRDTVLIASDGDDAQAWAPSSIAELVLALRNEGDRLAIRLASGAVLTYQLNDSAAEAEAFVGALCAMNENVATYRSERANVDAMFDGGALHLVDSELTLERSTGETEALFADRLLEVLLRKTTWNNEYGLVLLPSILGHRRNEGWPPFAGPLHVYCPDCRPISDVRDLVAGLKAANPALRVGSESVFRSP